MIVLDTNVVSALFRAQPEPKVAAWANSIQESSLWTSAVTVFEIRYGIEILEIGRRRHQLEADLQAAIENELNGRVLPFDQASAEASAVLGAARKRAGRPIDVSDLQIAGIALSRKASLATRNTKHFEGMGLSLIDPWKD